MRSEDTSSPVIGRLVQSAKRILVQQHHTSDTTQQSGLYLNNHTHYFKERKKGYRSEALHCHFGNYLGYFDEVFFFENWVRGFFASRVCQAKLVSFSR
jgi:hypothetical protein